MIILTIIAFAIIALMDLPKLIKNKYWYDLAVYSSFFIFALTIAVLQSFGVTMPNPMKGIAFVLKEILHFSYEPN